MSDLKLTYCNKGRHGTPKIPMLNYMYMSISLGSEYEFYKESKKKLLTEGREGKFVLIKDKSLVDFFDTEKEAYEEGVKRFGTDLFLIKQVLKEEPIERIQHFYVPLQ